MQRPATRERRERFIRTFKPAELRRAIDVVMHDNGGLNFFNDDQIAEISDWLVSEERSRTHRNIQNRRAWRAGRAA